MKNTSYLKIIATGLVVLSSIANAETTAKEGLQKIKSNLDNSQVNLQEYEKNLKIVEGNMTEVNKAKAQVEAQKTEVLQHTTDNDKALHRLNEQEKELQGLITAENEKLTVEAQKVKELEATILKIKETQKKREQNIADYQLQKNQLQEEKKIWNARGATIKEQSEQVAQKLKTLSSEETEWRLKQKGYQAEVKRWSQEVDRQKKINESYKSLSEVK